MHKEHNAKHGCRKYINQTIFISVFQAMCRSGDSKEISGTEIDYTFLNR